MKVHLGSGTHCWPGFCNVDMAGRFDVESDVRKLPFPDSTVDEIHAIHLFEHIGRVEVEPMMKEWGRTLKPGGMLVMEMPSLDKVTQFLANGEQNIRFTLLALYGDPSYNRPEMLHKWCYSEAELTQILTAAGYTNIKFKTPVFHIATRDLRVECNKETLDD